MPYADTSSEVAKASLRASRRKWYASNKEHAKSKIVDRKLQIRDWLCRHKDELRCTRCGEDDPACLDFHHSDPSSKAITIAKAATNGWSISRIESEIAKCEVVCANCHRKIHRDERLVGPVVIANDNEAISKAA